MLVYLRRISAFYGEIMKKNFYKRKKYAHFDRKIKIWQGRKFAENPQFVSHHGFYPFLHFKLKINRFFPDKEDLKERHEPKVRDIYYAAHIDRYIYQYYSHLLNDAYNKYTDLNHIDNCAVAYRTNKLGQCNINFAEKAFSFLKNCQKALIIVGDFTSFFDNLDHAYLKECLQKVLGVDRLSSDWFAVFHNITNASCVDLEKIFRYNKDQKDKKLPVTLRQINKQGIVFSLSKIKKEHPNWIKPAPELFKHYGIPQGSPISGVLANVYMIEFDKAMQDVCDASGAFYMRYSDDFIFIVPNLGEDEIRDKLNVVFSITKLIGDKGKLELKPEKTRCAYFIDKSIYAINENGEFLNDENKNRIKVFVNFLGFKFDGQCVDFRDKTRQKNYNKISHKARRLYKLKKGFKRRKDESKVPISLKGVNKVFAPVYRIDENGKRKSTFNSYMKRSMAIFSGEEIIKKSFIDRKKRLSKIINRTIINVNKQMSKKTK